MSKILSLATIPAGCFSLGGRQRYVILKVEFLDKKKMNDKILNTLNLILPLN